MQCATDKVKNSSCFPAAAGTARLIVKHYKSFTDNSQVSPYEPVRSIYQYYKML